MVVHEMADVNDYHRPTDVKAYFKAGYKFLGVKVTEGNSYTSGLGLGIVGEVVRAGGRNLFYHYATASASGTEQAQYFLAAILPHLRKGDAVCIDIEGQPKTYRQWSVGQPALVAGDFQKYINKHLPKGVLKLIYSNSAFFSEQKLPNPRGWHRWVASYGLKPGFWPRRSVAWQYTDSAHGIPGMPAGVDASHIRSVLVGRVPFRKHPRLRIGSTGPDVRLLQSLLNQHGAHLRIDGDFGKDTAAAVYKFKVRHYLPHTSVCGQRCWRALEA